VEIGINEGADDERGVLVNAGEKLPWLASFFSLIGGRSSMVGSCSNNRLLAATLDPAGAGARRLVGEGCLGEGVVVGTETCRSLDNMAGSKLADVGVRGGVPEEERGVGE
jgi:hypothetical protein